MWLILLPPLLVVTHYKYVVMLVCYVDACVGVVLVPVLALVLALGLFGM